MVTPTGFEPKKNKKNSKKVAKTVENTVFCHFFYLLK